MRFGVAVPFAGFLVAIALDAQAEHETVEFTKCDVIKVQYGGTVLRDYVVVFDLVSELKVVQDPSNIYHKVYINLGFCRSHDLGARMGPDGFIKRSNTTKVETGDGMNATLIQCTGSR